MDFLTDPIFPDFGRSDFIGGIDNEALDFGHLEQFIHVSPSTNSSDVCPPSTTASVSNVGIIGRNNNNNNSSTSNATTTTTTHSSLPESPPDSGSEHPFSPADLQGLTLTSRVTSSNGPTNNNNNDTLIDPESPLGQQTQPQSQQQSQLNNVKPPPPPPPPDLHATLTHHLTGGIHQNHHQLHQHQQHQQLHQNHNFHQHHLYVDQSDHHALLLASADHLQMHHGGADGTAPSTASPSVGVSETNGLAYSSENRQDQAVIRGLPDRLLAIDNRQHHHHHQHHHPHPHPHLPRVVPPGMSEIIDIEAQQGTPYNRQMMPQQQQQQLHAPAIIPSDVYMGTPAPIIDSTTTPTTTRKRKISQVDICASMMTIKPEPGATLSPLCQQNMNPTSPVTINMQQIAAASGIPGNNSPNSSSLSPTGTILSMSNDNNSMDGGNGNPAGSGTPNTATFGATNGSNGTDSSSESSPMQCIRFSPFQQHNWHTLCDQSLQELSMAHYRVDADKGFNFSVSDDAFVCQKKNHFQITCHARLQGDAKFVRTPSGLEKIKSFHLHFYGVKLEAPNQTIRVEQSQSDRSKKPFYPVPIDLQSHLVSKVTVGRLHFSETTNNNMRKKGRPNPEQRYFQLIVGLHVHTHSGHFPVVSQGSERIIVRASNPGQFESDVELCWQRGFTPESIFHAGRVGINTDRPDESLVIHGNLKVSGHIIQPSDSRAKQEISELNTAVQLRNLQKIRIVRYRYEPEFALHSGLKTDKDNNDEIIDTGVIAQEVREVLPDAVTEAGSIVLPSGQVIENFLLVNKDRILMENIGAVKELCKVTGSLETRIEQLEKINNRLMRMQEIERSKNKCKHLLMDEDHMIDGEDELCSNRTIQMMIIILVVIMATCLVAVSTLYFVEHSKQRYMKKYDRYDISHHPFTHDAHAMLVNNNNNNNNSPRNVNHNGYHTNKNGKLILHAHTQRPQLAAVGVGAGGAGLPPAAPLPLPIQQHSSNIPLILSPHQGISLIPHTSPLYPSGSGGPAAGISNLETPGSFSDSSSSIFLNSNLDNFGGNLHNDELLTGIDKIALPVVISSHINNKTASSKNKSKWPTASSIVALSSSTDVIATVMPAVSTFSNNFNEPLLVDDINLNVSETSSEKVADSIPVNPDFENNSIDGSDQQKSAPQKSEPSVDQQQVHPANNGGNRDGRGTATAQGSNENSVLVGAVAVSAKKITSGGSSSSTSSSLSSTSSSSSSSSSSSAASTIFVVYKNAQTSKSSINEDVSKHKVNFTVETPSITNKSHAIDAEETDLQSLGNNNNDSTDDQAFSETLTTRVIEKKFALAPIGIPEHCVKIKLEEISNCQSACFEDSNSLTTSSQNLENEIRRRHVQKLASGNTTSGSAGNNSALTSSEFINSIPKSHILISSEADDHGTGEIPGAAGGAGAGGTSSGTAGSVAAKIVNVESDHEQDQDQEASQQPHTDRAANRDDRDDQEELVLAFKDRKPTHKDASKRKIDTIEVQSLGEQQQRRLGTSSASSSSSSSSTSSSSSSSTECSTVTPWLQADTFNVSLGFEQICLNGGSSLNITYVIPLSKYLKETNVELHFVAPLNLHWTVCNNKEKSKRDGASIVNPLSNGKVFQKSQNVSIFYLSIPAHGHFERFIELRAATDSNKNLCGDDGDDVRHVLLQYNIRIERDCD